MSESTAVAVYEAPAANELEQWARDLTTAYQAARQLVTTSFVPKTYAGKPEEAAAAIMTGQELGLSPLAALRSIDIIGGVPAMRAIALRALVQSAGHEIWTDESTATQAVVKGRRKGSDKVETSLWTIERARSLQLLGKDNWKKQPIAMLLARATSELVRLIAADVILGIPYSAEELLDLGEFTAESGDGDAPRKAPARTTARRKPLPAKPDEPALPEDEDLKVADEQEAHQLGTQSASEPNVIGTLRGNGVVESSAPVGNEPPALTDAEIEEDARKAEERMLAEARASEPELDWDVPGMDR